MTGQLRAVDLFAGAGGMSHGLGQADFRLVSAVESDPQAADTYAAAHPGTALLARDVTTVSGTELTPRLRSRLDLLAAGPPCQGFSIKGSRRSDHPGNAMLAQVVRLAAELQPRAVLVENVTGLASLAGGYYFDRLVTGLERVALDGGGRYDVQFAVLDSSQHGAPQRRRRLFIVATEPGVRWAWPERAAEAALTVWDAIGDLPAASLAVGETAPYPTQATYSAYAAALRGDSRRLLNHHTKRLEATRLLRLAALGPGQDRRHLPEELAAGGHESKYRRLRANAPSPTLTAHMGKDLSDFIHPHEQRTLTLREAARLQGFPDRVEFLGSQAAQFRQVGNAVPVPLAHALGQALSRALRARTAARPTPPPAASPERRLVLVPFLADTAAAVRHAAAAG